MDAELVKYLVQRVEKIDAKVDELLKFKWQIISYSVAVGIFTTGLIQLVAFLIKL